MDDIKIDPALQKKLDQQALRAMALKYDLRPSQVRAIREELPYLPSRTGKL